MHQYMLDTDICIYAMAGAVNPETGWGLTGDTFAVVDQLHVMTNINFDNVRLYYDAAHPGKYVMPNNIVLAGNSGDDPVKMVFHPQFVTQTGPLIHLDYEQFVRGCHMGVFPSYYEPWGYTPMECVALGLPAVTTDLSGFGAYVHRHIPNSKDKGICVLNRRYRGFDEACNELVDYLFDFVRMSRRQRIELRNRVEQLSELFDWSALIRHYKEAHDMALDRIGSRVGTVEIRMV